MEVTSPPSLVYQQLVWRAASPLSAFQWTVQDSAALDLNAVPPFRCLPVRKGRHFWFGVPARSICCWTPRTAADCWGLFRASHERGCCQDTSTISTDCWKLHQSIGLWWFWFDGSITAMGKTARLAFWPLLRLTSNTSCNCILLHVDQCHINSMTAHCLNYNWYQWKATVTRFKSSEFLLPLLAPFQDFFGLDNHDPHQRPLRSSRFTCISFQLHGWRLTLSWLGWIWLHLQQMFQDWSGILQLVPPFCPSLLERSCRMAVDHKCVIIILYDTLWHLLWLWYNIICYMIWYNILLHFDVSLYYYIVLHYIIWHYFALCYVPLY